MLIKVLLSLFYAYDYLYVTMFGTCITYHVMLTL